MELCELLSNYAISFNHLETAKRAIPFLETTIEECGHAIDRGDYGENHYEKIRDKAIMLKKKLESFIESTKE